MRVKCWMENVVNRDHQSQGYVGKYQELIQGFTTWPPNSVENYNYKAAVKQLTCQHQKNANVRYRRCRRSCSNVYYVGWRCRRSCNNSDRFHCHHRGNHELKDKEWIWELENWSNNIGRRSILSTLGHNFGGGRAACGNRRPFVSNYYGFRRARGKPSLL